MRIKVESQILTRSPQHQSLLLQKAPGTFLKSTHGNAVLGFGRGYCMPGTVSVHPRERLTTLLQEHSKGFVEIPTSLSCASRGC